MKKAYLLAACLIGAIILGWVVERTPRALGLDAAPGLFSAGRAMAGVQSIAKVPHPVGSTANFAVRNYLVGRMTAMGLTPEVQQAEAFGARPKSKLIRINGANVENIVGILPGKDRSAPALALMAHYDSVPHSSGAGDDAAGVAAALEIVRVLKAGPPPPRDLMVILTDGEEAGLVGAKAFFGQNPLARRVGFVINLESRGNGGRVQMFQTSPQGGQIIDLFARSARNPAASSLTGFVYGLLPSDTDFTVSMAAKVPGLNYAFIGREADYHSPSSTPATLSGGTLQHLGNEALAMTTALMANPALPGKSADPIYAQTFGSQVLTYPVVAGWGVLALAFAMTALGFMQARRSGAIPVADVVKGVGAALYLLVGGIAFLRLARRATGAGFGFLQQQDLLARVSIWEAVVLLVAIGSLLLTACAVGRGRGRLLAGGLSLAAGMACSLFGGFDLIGFAIGATGGVLAFLTFGRAGGMPGVWTGIVALVGVIAIGLQVWAPTTTFLFTWPLVLAALLAAITAMGTRRSVGFLAVVATLGLIGLGWLLQFAHGIFLGLDQVEVLAVVALLAGLVIWPLVQPEPDDPLLSRVALIVLSLGYVGVAALHLISPWSARHPQPVIVAYVVDGDTQAARRMSFSPWLDAWTGSVLSADGGSVARDEMPLLANAPTWSASAMRVAVKPAEVSLFRVIDGSLMVKVTPPPGARMVVLDIKSTAPVTEGSVNGRPARLLTKVGEWSRVSWQASPEGFTVGFRAKGPGAVETRVAAITEGWPTGAQPLPPRSDRLAPWWISDSTIVTGTKRLNW